MAEVPHPPPLAALRVFEAAARLGSFTRAAAELGTTQAAVSYQVKVLEERLGAPLFLRRPRGIALTELGQALAPAVGEAFERLETAWAAALGGGQAMLRITTTLTFATNWLARRLGSFQIAHPAIAVRLDTSHRPLDFSRDEVDVAIRVGQGSWPGLATHRLLTSDFTPLLSPGLAQSIGGLQTPADLLKLPLVNPDDPWWAQWFAAAGVAWEHRAARSAGGHLGAQVYDAGAAIGGQGVAILTRAFYAEEIADGRLLQPFDLVCEEGFAYWLAYPRARRNAPKIRAFRAWLLGAFADLPDMPRQAVSVASVEDFPCCNAATNSP